MDQSLQTSANAAFLSMQGSVEEPLDTVSVTPFPIENVGGNNVPLSLPLIASLPSSGAWI